MSYNELKQHGTTDFPIELYHIDKSHTRYEMNSHWHSEIEIVRVLSGTLAVRLNNHTYTANPGDVVFVNSETVHGAVPSDCVYECLDFRMDFLTVPNNGCRFFSDGILNGEIVINEWMPYADDEVHRAVADAFVEMGKRSSGYKFKVIGALYRLFGTIIDAHLYRQAGASQALSEDRNVPRLKSVLSFIRSHYDQQISLGDIAAVAEMSPQYFCSFFRNMTRKSPIEYLNDYRIEKASRKLLGSNASVTEIAYSCGFNDLSYFIKSFKQIKGTTPSKFRKGI